MNEDQNCSSFIFMCTNALSKDQIYHTLSEELERSRRVVRTFTETGFDIGELPTDLFASMLTYYYNSYNNTYVEEWPSTYTYRSTSLVVVCGNVLILHLRISVDMVHINWWETASLLVSPPWSVACALPTP